MILKSAWSGPDEETLLSDVEVDVPAGLMRNVCAKVSPYDTVPYGLVLLFKG